MGSPDGLSACRATLAPSTHLGVLFLSLSRAEPRNMAYMTRLHLWGEGNPAFKDFSAFLEAVQVRNKF